MPTSTAPTCSGCRRWKRRWPNPSRRTRSRTLPSRTTASTPTSTPALNTAPTWSTSWPAAPSPPARELAAEQPDAPGHSFAGSGRGETLVGRNQMRVLIQRECEIDAVINWMTDIVRELQGGGEKGFDPQRSDWRVYQFE